MSRLSMLVIWLLIPFLLGAVVRGTMRGRVLGTGAVPPEPPDSGDLIPEEGRIDWSTAGAGTIPTYPVSITVTNPPYNAVGDCVADDTAAIQSAITAAPSGTAIFFPAGCYRVTGLDANRFGVGPLVLRGAGPAQTTIYNTGNADSIRYRGTTSLGTATAITGGLAKGSTVITVETPGNFSTGQAIWLSQLNDLDWGVSKQGYNTSCSFCGLSGSNGDRTMVQFNRITAITGNDLTLARPLYFTFEAANSPQAQRVAMVNGGGIEDMRVEQIMGTPTGAHNNIHFTYIRNGWVKNVLLLHHRSAGIRLEHCWAITVRDNYIADPKDIISGRGYGVMSFVTNGDHLIENNVIRRARHSLVNEGGGSGSVYGYNWAVDVRVEDPAWLSCDLNNHGAYPYMVLWEGNVGSKFCGDRTLGTNGFNTVFRNHITGHSTGEQTKTTALWSVDLQSSTNGTQGGSWYNNIIGNVIGLAGQTGVVNPTSLPTDSQRASFRLGFETPSSNNRVDQHVESTGRYLQNYEYIGNSIALQSTTTALPNSLYLAAQPSWWGAQPWPPIGPDLVPIVSQIPAQNVSEWPFIPPANFGLNPQTTQNEAVSSLTLTGYTPPPGNSKVLIVAIATLDDDTGDSTVTAVTCGAANLAQRRTHQQDDASLDHRLSLWDLPLGSSVAPCDITAVFAQEQRAAAMIAQVGIGLGGIVDNDYIQRPPEAVTSGTASSGAGITTNLTTLSASARLVDASMTVGETAGAVQVTQGPGQTAVASVTTGTELLSLHTSQRQATTIGAYPMGWDNSGSTTRRWLHALAAYRAIGSGY